jgi:uncharacterized protein (TIGR02466 family)
MITLWFPKAIYFQPNILNNRLGIYEQRIKDAFSSVETFRDGQKNVDSTHKSHKNILKVADLDWMLAEHFLLHAKQYLNALGYKKTDNLHIQNCWANISYPGDYIFPHNHNGSMISGVYYVKCSADEKIKFFNSPTMLPDPEEWNENNYQYCEYSCIPGSLLLFTSDIMHGTEKQVCEEKIAISFNMSL